MPPGQTPALGEVDHTSERAGCVISHTSHVTRHTSHVTRHTSHVTRHTSHVTRHTSHVTRHTSHVTRHTSHITRHTQRVAQVHPVARGTAVAAPLEFTADRCGGQLERELRRMCSCTMSQVTRLRLAANSMLICKRTSAAAAALARSCAHTLHHVFHVLYHPARCTRCPPSLGTRANRTVEDNSARNFHRNY